MFKNMEKKITTPAEYWEVFAPDCDTKILEKELDRVLHEEPWAEKSHLETICGRVVENVLKAK